MWTLPPPCLNYLRYLLLIVLTHSSTFSSQPYPLSSTWNSFSHDNISPQTSASLFVFFISHISIYAQYMRSNFLLILLSAFKCSLYATNLWIPPHQSHFSPHTPSKPYAIHTSIQQTCTHYFVVFFFRLRTSNGSYMFTW
jgi:hypothetical protein